MAGRSRNAPPSAGRRTTRSQARRAANASQESPSRSAANMNVYRDMLVESGAIPRGAGLSRASADPDERPAKRLRRPGERSSRRVEEEPVAATPVTKPYATPSGSLMAAGNEEDDDDEDVVFEDVALPAPTIQTTIMDSGDEDDEEEDEGVVFEDIDFGAPVAPEDPPSPSEEKPKALELNLTAHKEAMTAKRTVVKRKPISKAERARRVEVHKMHLCCMLVHAARRNRWCNDAEVQASLRPLLPESTVRFLKPRDSLIGFGRTESLKNGIQQARTIFKSAFEIAERGLRRALWAEDESHLESYELPDDLDSAMDKKEFRKAARTLEGSRDVGAQLFCALLRAVGVQARLVCSLQPLSFLSGAPTLSKPKSSQRAAQMSKAAAYRASMKIYDSFDLPPIERETTPPPVRRLGYAPPPKPSPGSSSRASQPTRKAIRGESPFPVYWVEVLDDAHQKWQPVDPLVTASQWRPAKLEPPLSDRNNCLCYAIAFAADGVARDVTRRYAKAYTSKTRRLRVDNVPAPATDPTAMSGEEWYERALSFFARPLGVVTELDTAEEAELAAVAAREPMPRNVADFKDHPLYALERHLRRHEVLVPDARPSGTVGAGSGKTALERIFRRRDVRIAWSEDRWYRMGRVVKPNEIPAKFLPRRARPKGRRGFDDDDDDDDEDPVLEPGGTVGVPIFTRNQTVPYEPDQVLGGRIPRNRFGNVDVFVPSMVPIGGVHIVDERAARAAFLIGVDYAPALTGFEFKGRQGTAVLRGVVVPVESAEAVRAVVRGLHDLHAEAEDEKRIRRLLRLWSRFLKVLRINERIRAGAEPDGDSTQTMLAPAAPEKGKARDEAPTTEGDGVEAGALGGDSDDEEDAGGGFFVPDDDDMGGGFLVE